MRWRRAARCATRSAGGPTTPPSTSPHWSQRYEINLYPINENMIIDPLNRTLRVDPRPNGIFVIIKPKDGQTKIKGFSMEVAQGVQLQFPMLHRNTKVKQLQCPYGQIFLAHKDPSLKDRISFFFRHNVDYIGSGKKYFKATVLENFSKYYTELVF